MQLQTMSVPRTLGRVPDATLERALDDLYAAAPDTFVVVRKQLVAELRATGDRAGANELKGARRPSTSAWALNQLARRQPQIIETLLARSNELRVAQARAGATAIDTMQETIRAHRRALAEATDAALEILGARANDGFRNEIVSSLRAASTDPDVGRELERGRLVREADVDSGFPDASHLTLVPEPPAPTSPAPKPRPPEKRAANRDRSGAAELAAQAARKLEQEQAVATEANRALQDAAAIRANEAAADAGRLEQRVKELETELDTTRRDLRDARGRSRDAKAEAARLTARLD